MLGYWFVSTFMYEFNGPIGEGVRQNESNSEHMIHVLKLTTQEASV